MQLLRQEGPDATPTGASMATTTWNADRLVSTTAPIKVRPMNVDEADASRTQTLVLAEADITRIFIGLERATSSSNDGTYTCIASSVIDGRTLHVLAMIPLRGQAIYPAPT